jgi:hypothetical protein
MKDLTGFSSRRRIITAKKGTTAAGLESLKIALHSEIENYCFS